MLELGNKDVTERVLPLDITRVVSNDEEMMRVLRIAQKLDLPD
jgi:hypothetical protein